MIRAWAPVLLAIVLAGFAGGLATAPAAEAPAGPAFAAAPSSPGAGDDCCPDGCTDCMRPCCQAQVLACLAPSTVVAGAPRAAAPPNPIESQRAPARLRSLDRPPRF